MNPVSDFFQFHIEERDAGRRVDDFFASRFGGLSRMRISSLIEAGACLVNGAAGRAGYRIAAGDSIEVTLSEGGPTAMSPEPIPLDVIFEDEHVILIVKPAGMLVHPTMSVKSGTLTNALAYHLNRSRIEDVRWRIDPRSSILNEEPVIRPGLIHRLDRATSGLMVVAKTPRALTILSRHFRKRLVQKRYLALVRGTVLEDTGSITAPIGRDADQHPHWRVMESGKPAETRFTVLERLERATVLELEPVTGRTNQLRIHCAHIGHPIVGDEMQGNCESRMSNFESKTGSQSETQQSAIRNSQFEIRTCLHAWKLAFHHPASGEWLQFTAPVPGAFSAIIESFRGSP